MGSLAFLGFSFLTPTIRTSSRIPSYNGAHAHDCHIGVVPTLNEKGVSALCYCEDPPWGWKESIQGHSFPPFCSPAPSSS